MADLGSSLNAVLQVPGLQELLNQSITQQRQAAPLRTAINQQAVNMLPNSAFTRPDMAAIPQANYSTPPDSGGMSPILAALLGAGGGAGLTLLLQKLLGGNKGGGGSGGGGNGTGGGSSFQFGGNDIKSGLQNLFNGRGWNNDGSRSSNPNGLPYGPWEPNDPSSPFYTQGKTYGPWEPNDPSNPFTQGGGGDINDQYGDFYGDTGGGGGDGGGAWADNQSEDGF